MSAGSTPQRAAQAAHIAQLEESLASLQFQQQQLQAEAASHEAAQQDSQQKVARVVAEAAQANKRAQEAEQLLESQSKELSFLQVICSLSRAWDNTLPTCGVRCSMIVQQCLAVFLYNHGVLVVPCSMALRLAYQCQ